MLLVVVVEADTPDEPAEAFDSHALKPKVAATAKATRAKDLMIFILLFFHLRSQAGRHCSRLLADAAGLGNRIRQEFLSAFVVAAVTPP